MTDPHKAGDFYRIYTEAYTSVLNLGHLLMLGYLDQVLKMLIAIKQLLSFELIQNSQVLLSVVYQNKFYC